MSGRRWVLAVVVLASAVPVASCGDGGGSTSGARSPSSAAEGRASNGLATGEQAGATEVRTAEDRRIVYTADLTVRVDDSEGASARATRIAERAGGYLARQEADLADERRSTLTLRVPAEAFRPTLDALGELGEVLDRQIDSTEVTAEVVDLTGRLKGVQASADRLRGLLAEAPSTSEIVEIERELADREEEVESLQGKLRVLDDQTSLATITARLGEEVAAAPKPEPNDPPSFLTALKAGSRTLYRMGQMLAAAVGFLLPFIPLALLGLFTVRWWRRRHPSRRPGPVGGPGGGPVAPHLPPPPAGVPS